jgi:hypothetical protein
MTNEIRGMFKENVAVGELQAVVERYALGQVKGMAKALLVNGTTAPDELQGSLDMFDYGKRLWNTEPAGPAGTAAAAEEPPA